MSNLSITASFYLSPIIDKIHEAGDSRAGHDLLRESIFVRLMVFSADGIKFSDAKHFAKLLGVPLKQAALVWETCLTNKVLRKIGTLDEYSAFGWMKDNGLVPCTRPVETKTKQTSTPKPKAETNTSKITDVNELLCQESEAKEKAPSNVFPVEKNIDPLPSDKKWDNEIKEQVRPNVRLTRQELLSLKKSYSDEEISRMLDRLSEYKTNTGRTYSSDYQAIIKWVCTAVKEQRRISKPAVELPSWLFGETA